MDALTQLSDLPLGFAARPATWDDVDAVTDLVAACELFDDGAAEIDRDDIVADWQRPSFDLAVESVAIMAGDAMVAQADVFRGRAEVNVRPDWRGRGLGTRIAPRTEAVARSSGATKVGQLKTDNDPGALDLLKRHGYTYGHTSWVLRIDHAERPPKPALPPGIGFREYVPGRDDSRCTGSSRTRSANGRTATRRRSKIGRPCTPAARASSRG